jgi:hypothetical protein
MYSFDAFKYTSILLKFNYTKSSNSYKNKIQQSAGFYIYYLKKIPNSKSATPSVVKLLYIHSPPTQVLHKYAINHINFRLLTSIFSTNSYTYSLCYGFFSILVALNQPTKLEFDIWRLEMYFSGLFIYTKISNKSLLI